ncbi:MAG: hypothetical protein QOE80_4757, partial [Actinomycetota bacterium]|nr:hypothetical protein [Actinomycetota bacterium]
MSVRRLHQLRGYVPVVALATAFVAVSALTVPAHRLQLTVGVDAGGAGATGEAAAPVATGAAASGAAAGGAVGNAVGPATTRPSGPTAPRRVTRPGHAGLAGSDEVAGEPLGA